MVDKSDPAPAASTLPRRGRSRAHDAAAPASGVADASPGTDTERLHVPALQRVLAVVTALLLLVDAWVHFSDAQFYENVATAVLSQATLFRLEGAAAVAVAIALLIRPHYIVWAAAALVAAGGAAAVLLYTYVDVGVLGPLPNMFEPTWQLPGKPQSAVAEVAATVFALTGLALSLVTRRRAGLPRATVAK
jgi:hypothetical protein